MSSLGEFPWATRIVAENFPEAKIVTGDFDSGMGLGIAWTLPNGKRTAVKLRWCVWENEEKLGIHCLPESAFKELVLKFKENA